VVLPAAGHVRFDGADLTRRPPAAHVRAGLALVPEGRRILVSLTVHENLLMGAYARRDRGSLAREIERIYERFPNLAIRRDYKASVLSGGEQQMLAIGRALMAKPRLLLLDEPSMGLAPVLVEQIFDTVLTINRQGVTILLDAQNAAMALSIAERGDVLETGRLALEGRARELADNPEVRRAYLGEA
jgi:branched-chain amino acid transport system ATP-binding protein